jgi:hypothetical protein
MRNTMTNTSGPGYSAFRAEPVGVQVRASYLRDRWQQAPISAAREADP